MIARLGSFLIEERIGEGGMASVYLARHQLTDAPVAIKVVRPTSTASRRATFLREVESHARLLHPNIVCLYDVGEVDAEAEEASGGALLQGSGFIAMELAGGVVSPQAPRAWGDVEALLLQALDGLAYAHARGMIHRDLKPENLLCFDASEGTRIKLADFGISVAFETRVEGDVADLENISGTPLYMAPEQINADWPQYGPWTDIYALGCMAWELVCGRPPLTGRTTLDVLRAHLEAPRPALQPLFAVPAGFEGWVQRAMAISPVDRFRRAADAGRALLELRGDAIASEAPAALDIDQDQNMAATWSHTLAPLMGDTTMPLVAEARESARTIEIPRRPARPASAQLDRLFEARPPIPRTWREGATSDRAHTTPMGLGLYPLRARPLIGRVAERDALWRALHCAASLQRTEVVIIEGARGDGSSALVDWLVTRSRELGAGGVLSANFDPNALDPGFRGLVRRLYHAWGMSRGRLYEFILGALPPLPDDRWREADARALTEVAIPYATEAEGPMFEFASPRQKLVLASRLLRRLGRLNLPILVCDNTHADFEARAFVEHLVQGGGPPCLVVLILKKEAVDDTPSLRAWSDQLLTSPKVRRIELHPLQEAEHRELIDRLLPLSPDLSAQVVARTLGNPGFAVQLLNDWVERGLLEMGEDGYRAQEGVELPIPDDAHAVCLGRIERALRDVPGDSEAKWRAMELAALLGSRVDKSEWAGVVGASTPIAPLISAFTRAGLGRDDDVAFEFTFGLLTEALIRRVEERGDLRAYHRSCALGLDLAPSRGETLARQAEHWLAAGEVQRALDAIGRAGREFLHAGEYRQRARLVERQVAIVEEMELAPDHPHRLDAMVEHAHMVLIDGDRHLTSPTARFDAARSVADVAYAAAIRQSNHRIACKAKRLLAVASLRQGDFGAAVTAGRRSVDHGRHDVPELCESLVAYGDALRLVGALDEALAIFDEAQTDQQISPYLAAFVQWSRASILHARGDLDGAREQLSRVVERAVDLGHLSLQAKALNDLGDIARVLGDLAEARERFEAVRDIGEQIERPLLVAIANANLAQTELFDGNVARATELVDAVGAAFAGTVGAESIRILRLALSAAQADWATVAAACPTLQEAVRRPGAPPDEAKLVEFMMECAERAGEHELAASLTAILER